MKIEGHTFDRPNTVDCYIPRNGKVIVFTAQAVLDYDEFDRLCPVPKPPVKILPGGGREPNAKDPTFLISAAQHAERKLAYLVLKSLEATPNLKWDKVDLQDPKTWLRYPQELKAAFFSEVEIQRIQNAVFEANSLSEARIQEARENFLRGKAEEAQDTSSLPSELNSTLNGEPAND